MNDRLTYELTNRIPALRRRRTRRRAQLTASAAAGAAVGAGLVYLLDPVSGRRRRHVSRDRLGGSVRRLWRRTSRAGRRSRSAASGLTQKALHHTETEKDFDDVTLARKVESEVFRDPTVPKGQIVVNVQRGVVQLRGEVPSADMLEALVQRTRDVQGVQRVESLLHLPGTPAPMHQ